MGLHMITSFHPLEFYHHLPYWNILTGFGWCVLLDPAPKKHRLPHTRCDGHRYHRPGHQLSTLYLSWWYSTHLPWFLGCTRKYDQVCGVNISKCGNFRFNDHTTYLQARLLYLFWNSTSTGRDLVSWAPIKQADSRWCRPCKNHPPPLTPKWIRFHQVFGGCRETDMALGRKKLSCGVCLFSIPIFGKRLRFMRPIHFPMLFPVNTW